jgi:hypothetical protein
LQATTLDRQERSRFGVRVIPCDEPVRLKDLAVEEIP